MASDFVRIDETEEEYWDDEVAICPYCGFKNRPEESDGYLYDQSTDTYTCEYCNEEFEVEVYVKFNWITKRGLKQ